MGICSAKELWKKEPGRRACQAERIEYTKTFGKRLRYDGFKELRKIQSGWNDKSQGEDVCDMETEIAT